MSMLWIDMAPSTAVNRRGEIVSSEEFFMKLRGSEIGTQLGESLIKRASLDSEVIADFVGVRRIAAIAELHVVYFWLAAQYIRETFDHPHDTSILRPLREIIEASLRQYGVAKTELAPLFNDREGKFEKLRNIYRPAEFNTRLADIVIAICMLGSPGGSHRGTPTPEDVELVLAHLTNFDRVLKDWLAQFRTV